MFDICLITDYRLNIKRPSFLQNKGEAQSALGLETIAQAPVIAAEPMMAARTAVRAYHLSNNRLICVASALSAIAVSRMLSSSGFWTTRANAMSAGTQAAQKV